MTKDDEQIFLQKAKEGDLSAFEEIVKLNEKNVYKLSLKQLGNQQDAEDATQEVFIKAFTGLHSFRGDSRISVWLYRITFNVCTDIKRKSKDTVSLSIDTDEDQYELEFPDSRYDPAVILEQHDISNQISNALFQLSNNSREILLLRDIGGLSYEDISKSLQIDIGTVKSRIFRARKKLCQLLLWNNFEYDSSKNKIGGRKDEQL